MENIEIKEFMVKLKKYKAIILKTKQSARKFLVEIGAFNNRGVIINRHNKGKWEETK